MGPSHQSLWVVLALATLWGGRRCTCTDAESNSQSIHELFGKGTEVDTVDAFRVLREQLDAEYAQMLERKSTLPEHSPAPTAECDSPVSGEPGATPAVKVPSTSQGKLSRAVTCQRPKDRTQWRNTFNDKLLDLELEAGRACADPLCQRCGLELWEAFVTPDEAVTLIEHAQAVMSEGKRRADAKKKQKSAATPMIEEPAEKKKQMIDLSRSALYGTIEGHVLLVKVLERMRRAVSETFDLPLGRVRLSSHFVSKITDQRDLKESSWHCDESSFTTFHFSGVLWLSTAGEDFDGGLLVFRANETDSSPLAIAPRVGRAAFFSSGWENIHRVEPVTKGARWSIPIFVEVVPSPADARRKRFVQQCIKPKSVAAYDTCLEQWQELLD